MAILPIENSEHRIFYIDSEGIIGTVVVRPGRDYSFLQDPALYNLKIRLPYPKFAVIAGKSDPPENFLYYQENGTHIGEISYQRGYWRSKSTMIPIT